MAATKQLNRSLGLRLVVVIVIGNIIGSGVYKKVAPMAVELQSPVWVLLCWVLAGIITLFGALCNAEVAGQLADTGGEYAYYQTIYNKFFAFLFGWSLFTIIQTAAISSLAYVFAQSLSGVISLPDVLPSLSGVNIGHVFYPFADLTTKLVAIALIVFLTWINARGIKTGANFSTLILVLVITGILLIIFFGLSSHTSAVAAIAKGTVDTKTPLTTSAIFTGMLSAFWAYQGWAGIGYVGGEVKNAHRNIPKGIVIGVFIVIALYLLVNLTYLSLLTIPQLQEIHQAGNKIAAVEAVKNFWGTKGALFISVLIMLTTLGCTNATVLASSRPYFAMAREGLFFRRAGKLNDAQAPAGSLLLQGVWACMLVFSGTFDQLTDMIIFAVFVYYGATTLGVFILRKKRPNQPRPYKVWGYPVVPAIVVLFCLALFLNTIIARPREAAIGIVLMLTGVPMYWWFKKRNPIHQKRPT
jgi:APA family basic amino acid/polyamine antiporter